MILVHLGANSHFCTEKSCCEADGSYSLCTEVGQARCCPLPSPSPLEGGRPGRPESAPPARLWPRPAPCAKPGGRARCLGDASSDPRYGRALPGGRACAAPGSQSEGGARVQTAGRRRRRERRGEAWGLLGGVREVGVAAWGRRVGAGGGGGRPSGSGVRAGRGRGPPGGRGGGSPGETGGTGPCSSRRCPRRGRLRGASLRTGPGVWAPLPSGLTATPPTPPKKTKSHLVPCK